MKRTSAMLLALAGLTTTIAVDARPHGGHGHRGGFHGHPHCRTYHDHGRHDRICQ